MGISGQLTKKIGGLYLCKQTVIIIFPVLAGFTSLWCNEKNQTNKRISEESSEELYNQNNRTIMPPAGARIFKCP